MKIKKTYIKDLLILEYEVFKDNRGFFTELYNSNVLKQYFICKIIYLIININTLCAVCISSYHHINNLKLYIV